MVRSALPEAARPVGRPPAHVARPARRRRAARRPIPTPTPPTSRSRCRCVQSITARYDELVTVWDSGRVGSERARPARRAHLGATARSARRARRRSRSPKQARSPPRSTDRLAAALSADAVAGSGVAGRIAPSPRRSTGAEPRPRCSDVGRRTGSSSPRVSNGRARVQDREQITTTVTALDTEVTGLERDLIKETGLRARAPRTCSRELAASVRRTRATRRDSRRTGGAMPLEDHRSAPTRGSGRHRARRAAGSRATTGRIHRERTGPRPERARRVRPAATRADASGPRRGRGALRRAARGARDDLRGLLGAYRDPAARSGLAEDVPLTDAVPGRPRRALDCALRSAGAQKLVERVPGHAVRVAVGARPRRRDATLREGARRERATLRRTRMHRRRSRTATATSAAPPGPVELVGELRRPRSGATGRGSSLSTKLSSTPIGSARAGLSRPTRRLVTASRPRAAPRRRHHQRSRRAGRRPAIRRPRRTHRCARRSASAPRAARPSVAST